MDSVEVHFLREFLLNNNVERLLDIGANRGEYSLFAKSIIKHLDCLMIEANEKCKPYLESTGIPYVISCLSNHENILKLYKNSQNETCTGVSYYKELTHHYDDQNFSNVKAEMLSSIFQKKCLNTSFDLIKIDTQGSEKDIMLGGIDIVKNARFIQLEVSIVSYNDGAPLKDEIISFMNDMQFFAAHTINYQYSSGVKIQENIMFMNSRFS